MYRKRIATMLVSLIIGLAALGSQRNAIAQGANPVTDNRLRPANSQQAPSDMRKTDPDRLPTDVDTLVCKALKAEYDKCAPVCGQGCEAIYDEARECPGVDRHCRQ
jgi:hypothetical protein